MKHTTCYLLIVFTITILTGCAMSGIATKEDISEVEGTLEKRQSVLAEDVLALKKDVQSLKMRLNDELACAEEDIKTERKTLQVVSAQILDIRKEISSLKQVLTGIKSENKTLLDKEVKRLDEKITSTQREIEKKLDIVVDEITKENNRLSNRIDSLINKRGAGISNQAQKRTPKHGPGEKIHVIERGESLSLIAARYGVTISSIVEYNNLSDPDAIYPGQEIAIPEKE